MKDENSPKPVSKSGESPDSNPAEMFEVRVPKYRRHKKIYARVVLNGREIHLGLYGSPESKANYEREVAQWLQTGRKTPRPKRQPPSVEVGRASIVELCVKYVEFADGYYRRPDGTPTGEAENVRDALRPLNRMFGDVAAESFSIANLKTIQNQLIREGLARSTVNKRINIIRRMFKWAARESFIPASVAVDLMVVEGLRKGRTNARETEPVRPAPDSDVDAIEFHTSPIIWAMVQIQRWTGMRPGEVCKLRTIDIDQSGEVWEYRPLRHKTEHHGKKRRVFFGPLAQSVVMPWLKPDRPGEFVFPPEIAIEIHRTNLRKGRKSKVQPSQVDRSRPDPKIRPGKCYQVGSYCRAVERACIRAGVAVWHPNQLRHLAATNITREFGIDVARTVLGHGSITTTDIYAEMDATKARDAMAKSG